ncbi:PREDICTED: biorientation of chromosomes in cell division protein 1-like 1 isoform X2 [Polistes dominula]|uniref:Biorientation of chromosomes in cell division protein 1-like 1 isoform X2 n=1 Tax=Polistes dominula TaxID=743375 RepID=A0ABM1J0V7_POLDO|nr:PREDICTED: biorientation of chromosomes in cell division protein 1-like 1 isoform X2 [Polistes dominula]
MELGLSSTLLAGDPHLVDRIVGEVKSQGIFDQFRKECIADVDTKPAYQNLRTRVEGSVNSFLDKQQWKPELNKNQVRETLRKHIHEAPYLDVGVERIVDQVVNPKVFSVFMPQIEDVVYKFLGLERPKMKEKSSACGLKDLLPKDLDPVSPESDKNSLKDVSLESVDAIDDIVVKPDDKSEQSLDEQKLEIVEKYLERSKEQVSEENGHTSSEEKVLGEECIDFNKTAVSNVNLNTSGKSDDKVEEEEEDSPTFEPIDIMNLNESNISNDSHLSGISELTSHRSRSPNFSNEVSQDNYDCSNQDSQLSKVSSDSRLSIVTDFGLSNHASTPIHDGIKEELVKDKCEIKTAKDNFRALREFESFKNKNNKNIVESKKCKESGNDLKDTKDTTKSIKLNLPSKENSSDATDNSTKDKYDSKISKDKHKDSEISKSKSKDKICSKETKCKEKDNEKKKQSSSSSSHSSSKHDKHIKDNVNKMKEDKVKEMDKKESNTNKESKDLKDLYKEKIRELREKKELTEKEKLNKDNVKSNKESRDKKDSSKDKKSYKKEHRSSTSKSHDDKSRHENKINKGSSDKISDIKDKKSESKDKTKRDERSSKDIKDKSNVMKTESSSKSEKSDLKKMSKNGGKDEKMEIKKDIKISSDKNCKKDVRTQVQSNKTSDKSVDITKKDSKSDAQSKDKKRRDDKKSKTKDDHSSLRKNSNDRRSTDRDGSNGSNSKSSQSSTSSSNATTSKSSSSGLTKDTSHMSNSSSETSDSIGETEINKMKLQLQNENYDDINKDNINLTDTESSFDPDNSFEDVQLTETQSNENNLPLKKRPLLDENDLNSSSEMKLKKPKFAKNIHEAKKLMKIRKQMEKLKQKDDKKIEKKVDQKTELCLKLENSGGDDLTAVPDEERVQIIEVRDEEYEEPYPDRQMNLTLEQRSMILLEGELHDTDGNVVPKQPKKIPKLSALELCIKQSLDEAICHTKLQQQDDDAESQALPMNKTCKDDSASSNCSSSSSSSSSKDSLEMKTNDTVETSETFLDASQRIEKIKSINTITKNSNKVRNQISTSDTNISVEHSVISNDRNNDNEEFEQAKSSPSRDITEYNELDEQLPGQANAQSSKNEFVPKVNDDYEDCRYFKLDNKKSDRFLSFFHSLEMVGGNTLEEIIEGLGGQIVVSSGSKTMAPPMPKRKHSGSPLTDILLHNSNNNNDGLKISMPNDNPLNAMKKRKMIASKKQRLHANPCISQSLLNGENFVMPLSPESDVSATSEKIPSSNIMKEEKSRNRSSQRYSSDDLYKPRPLFSSSSRRSRRFNQV